MQKKHKNFKKNQKKGCFMGFVVKNVFPTNEEFNKLFYSVGWGNRKNSKINEHRKSSVYSVCVYSDDEIIGMARVVGDGAYYTVYDVVVDSAFQGKGVGALLMEKIVNWYKSIEDDDSYLYLGASFGKEGFYEKFGFKARPYGHIGAGMKYDVD